MKAQYLNQIVGLPEKKREGHNTRKGAPRSHIYKVVIGDNTYYKFQVNRAGKQYTTYFKTRTEAKNFLMKVKTLRNIKLAKKVVNK